jgi:hypothetical protein
MTFRLWIAALAATGFALVTPANAGCVIAPDGKSISAVTDNGASDEKTCAVSCKVDTKIGVVQVACGGTTPPFAKAHSLCEYDKPEFWYKKVISSEDSCKGGTSSPPPPAAQAPVKPGTFICRISADGHSFDAMIENPFKAEAYCQVNCQVSTTLAGTTEQSSCSRPVATGVGPVVLCSHTFDKGKLVKVVGGSGECTDPTPKPAALEKDDDDELSKLKDDPDKLDAYMQKQLEQAQKLKPKGGRQDSAEDLQKLMDDPGKMDDYIRKQIDPASQKLFDEMNKK